MKKINALETFYDYYYNIFSSKNIPKIITYLQTFVFYPKTIRNKIALFNRNLKRKDNGYVYISNGKEIEFEVLSDKDILQKVDKNLLFTELFDKTHIKVDSFMRTLKLTGSLDLSNIRLVIGNSLSGIFDVVIMYDTYKNKEVVEKVIDYKNNIIMNKDDYYELFEFSDINVINKSELHKIFSISKFINEMKDIYLYLIFKDEIFKDLSKFTSFKFTYSKYDEAGINYNNYCFFGNNFDTQFFSSLDRKNRKFKKYIDEIEDFTLGDCKPTRKIKKTDTSKVYNIKIRDIGSINFSLLSDIINENKTRENLKTTERYGKCHVNSRRVANKLSKEFDEKIYLISGKQKYNDVDYYYHSWIEVKNEEDDNNSLIIDYNRNVIMRKDYYNKLFSSVVISEIDASKIEEIDKVILEDVGLKLYSRELNYFGEEIMRDLQKNAKVLNLNIKNIY